MFDWWSIPNSKPVLLHEGFVVSSHIALTWNLAVFTRWKNQLSSATSIQASSSCITWCRHPNNYHWLSCPTVICLARNMDAREWKQFNNGWRSPSYLFRDVDLLRVARYLLLTLMKKVSSVLYANYAIQILGVCSPCAQWGCICKPTTQTQHNVINILRCSDRIQELIIIHKPHLCLQHGSGSWIISSIQELIHYTFNAYQHLCFMISSMPDIVIFIWG